MQIRRIPLALMLAALAVTLTLCVVAVAQLATSRISGIVRDASGAVISGARIIIINKPRPQTPIVSLTSADGSYTVTNLEPSTYEVRVERTGFQKASVDNVIVGVGESVTVDISLSVGSASEAVEVTAGPIQIELTSSHVSGSVSERTIASLPLNGRNFLDLAFLIPGNAPAPNFDPTKTTTVEVSSAGQLGRGGNIAVDGADNNDDVVGGTLQNFPQDGIGEFQVMTNRFSAEIGRSASSAVNIVTKTGTNKIHGSGAFFFRNDSLSSRLATNPEKAPFDREQYAASIGGPFKRDKAFGFGAVEFRNQDGVVPVGVRDLNRNQVVASLASAQLNDLLLTTHTNLQISASDQMALRYSYQDEDDVDHGSLRQPIGTAENRQHSFNTYHSFAYNWTQKISPTLVSELIVHENKFINKIPTFVEGKNEIRFPSVQDGGNFRIPQRTRQNRFQIRENLSWVVRAHSLKLGGEYQKLDTDALFDLFGSGTIFTAEDFATRDRNADGRIDDSDILIAMTIRSVAPNRPPVVSDMDNSFIAVYLQDDWKIRPNLTFNIGLRYELDTNVKNLANFKDINPILTSFLSGKRERDKNNFGPRLGFNWDPWNNTKTSIHGGYGIYYDRIVLEVPLLERLLDGRKLALEARGGSQVDSSGRFVPGTPTLSSPFIGTLIPGVGVGINILDNKLSTPYVQQFNLGIQRQIIHNLTASIDVIHSFGSKFIIGRTIGSVFNPVIGGKDDVVNIESSVKNWYDALLVNVQKLSNRLYLNASYTLAKAFNYSNDDQIPFQVPPLDPSNLRLEKGPPPNDERHRFTVASNVEMLGNVELSSIFTLTSGVPFDIQLPPDIGGTRIPLLQRNAAGREFKTGRELNSFIDQVNAGGGIKGVRLPRIRDDIRFGDSFTSLDLRLTKVFKIGDRWRLQAIAEVFNLFNVTNIRGVNNVNFSGFQNVLIRDSADPNSSGFLKSSSFGSALQTAGGVFGTGGPRSFQFGARVTF